MRRRVTMPAAVCLLAVAACSGAQPSTPTSTPPADPARDRLAQVLARGTLILTIDPAYPPASFAVEGAQRANGTRCEADQLTGPEVDGYDVATSKLIATALDVEPCFVTPPWSLIVGGHWGDRWDLSFASIGITTSRMSEIYFTRPYYATPERFYVRTTSSAAELEDLQGKRIGVCADCFADLYLQEKLEVPGATIEFRVHDAVIVPYQTEQGGLQDVSDGKLDAFLCQETAGQQAIAEGGALRALDPAPYAAFLGGALDRSSTLSARALFDRVNAILGEKLGDGTLAALATKHFGSDYAALTTTLDYGALRQDVQ